ncbi:phage tail tape measure protein [Clostridium sp. CF012]|uniref:phage tail tape measure protein n=1 Tax=Clostridium sp. CF012 TaxID=2843319 RepID=UPI001C0BF307|nr:phage tail tape measure protein [Clostridium sp. CF012]MBU3142224.1 phage tail tape measure protein [Clostridium sp. CF012]
MVKIIGVKTGLDISSVNKTKQEFAKLLSDLQNQANKSVIKIQISNTTSQINSINNSMNTLGSSANNTSSSFKNLGSSLGSLTGFYMRWLSVSSLVNLALMETRKAVSFAFEQDERVRNVSMISGESRSEVQGYTKDWNALALELKQSTSIVSESNEEWLRSGATLSEITELSKMTIKTSEIAGSKIKDTTSQAIALKNAYGLTGDGLKNVLDSVVKMDNTSATGTDRLLRSLLVTSSTAKQAKVPIDYLVAGLTTVQSKSKQTAESVGKNFRNIFLNMTKMTNGEDQIGLNKAEDQLNKINITMRSTKDTFKSANQVLDDLAEKWSTLTEVQQAELGASLAQKENINTFNILMQNQAETLRNLNNIKLAGGSVDKAYEEHLISAKGSLGELKATLEHLYTQLVNGDVLKSVLNDLTKIVHVVEFLVTDGKDLTKVWIGMLIAVKNFKLIEVGIMGCVTAFKYLHAFGLEALTLLSFNPIVLGFAALAAVVATVTYSQYQHSKQVKELKSSYELLNKSISEMNGDEIKSNTDKLKEQQKVLDELAKKASESYDVDLGLGYATNGDKEKLNKFIKTLEEAGFSVDKTKNKIIELGAAESNIATSDSIKAIQNKTNATIEEATETQGLIGSYMSLSKEENLSADKKKILSNLTTELVGRVDGLVVSTDSHGNAVVSNIGYLNNQITALDLVKQQSVLTGNTEISMAINSASAIHAGTMQSLDDMKSKILSYQSLNSALSNTSTGKNGYFDTIISANKIGEKGLQDSVNRIESLKSIFNMKLPTVSASTGGSGYKPQEEPKKAKKDTGSNSAEKSVNEALLLKDRYYSLNQELLKTQNLLDINASLQSNAQANDNIKEAISLQKEEIELLKKKQIAQKNIESEQAKERSEITKILSSKGIKFNGLDPTNSDAVLQQKLNAVNAHRNDKDKTLYNSLKKEYDNFNTSLTRFFTLQNTEIPKTKAGYQDLAIEISKVTKAIKESTLEQINSLLEKQKVSAEIELKQQQQNEINKLSSSIYGGSGTSDQNIKAYDEENLRQQDAIQKQIDSLNEVNDIQEEIETRLKNQNDLTEKQTALQNAQNNKNVQTLTKQADGSFQFGYVADAQAVESAQKSVNDQIKSNNDWEKSTALKHQTETLNKLKQSLADQKTAKDKDYNEQLSILEAHQTIETNLMTLHYNDMNLLADEKLKILRKTYGNNWVEIIKQLTLDVATAQALQNSLALSQASGTLGSTVKGTTGVGNSASITVNTEVDKAMLQAKYGSGVNIIVSSGDGATGINRDATYALNEKILSSQGVVPRFASGGEVGSWSGSSSKLAMVDTKERVLSSTQTTGFNQLVQELPRTLGSMERIEAPKLSARDVMPDYGQLMTYIPKGLMNMSDVMDKINLSSVNNNTKQGEVHHNYNIKDVNFPNANSTEDIISALTNLQSAIWQKSS